MRSTNFRARSRAASILWTGIDLLNRVLNPRAGRWGAPSLSRSCLSVPRFDASGDRDEPPMIGDTVIDAWSLPFAAWVPPISSVPNELTSPSSMIASSTSCVRWPMFFAKSDERSDIPRFLPRAPIWFAGLGSPLVGDGERLPSGDGESCLGVFVLLVSNLKPSRPVVRSPALLVSVPATL